MTIQTCTKVKLGKNECCYKTTVETIEANQDINLVNFPALAKAGDTHIVQFNDSLVFYEFTTEWVLKINHSELVFKDTSSEFPDEGKVNNLYIDKETATVYIWNGVAYEVIVASVIEAPLANKVTNIKVALRGGVALTGNVMPMTTLMAAGNYIPLLEPYKGLGYTRVFFGDETVSALSVFSTNNITDWILVELRDKHNPSIVKYNRAALLRSDGQIMDIDGTTNLTFTGIIDDTYFVSIKHRNHIGLMTKDPVDITALLDFTDASTQVYGIENRLTDAGVSYLRAGKIYDGGPIQYFGDQGYAPNAYNHIGAASLNAAVNGYSVFDLNLNGIVKLNLASNDNTAFSNSNSDPTYLYSNVYIEQIPNLNTYQFDPQFYSIKTSFQLPKGASSQRLFSPIGSIRYNTDNNKLEFFNGSAWETVTSAV